MASDSFFDCSVLSHKTVALFPREVIRPLRQIGDLRKYVPPLLNVRHLLTKDIPIAFHVFSPLLAPARPAFFSPVLLSGANKAISLGGGLARAIKLSRPPGLKVIEHTNYWYRLNNTSETRLRSINSENVGDPKSPDRLEPPQMR